MASAAPPLDLGRQEGSRELARRWRTLDRMATIVALLTAPAVYLYVDKRLGWDWRWAPLTTAVGVIAFRGPWSNWSATISGRHSRARGDAARVPWAGGRCARPGLLHPAEAVHLRAGTGATGPDPPDADAVRLAGAAKEDRRHWPSKARAKPPRRTPPVSDGHAGPGERQMTRRPDATPNARPPAPSVQPGGALLWANPNTTDLSDALLCPWGHTGGV